MQIQDYKAESTSRELATVILISSRHWYRLQWAIKILATNLVLLALLPYIFLISIQSYIISLLLLNLFFSGWIYFYRPFKPVQYQVACKQGIWKLTHESHLHYAQLKGEIIIWQWLLIIPLYAPAQNQSFTLVVLNDSATPQDLSRLRRWVLSEFV